jgi:hypothetical protein
LQTATQTVTTSRAKLWTGRILSALPALFMLWSGVIKLMNIAPVKESFIRLGYSDQVALGIGILEIACVLLYAIPRTAVLGAILLTGYLGGATATHVRIDDPYYFPIVLGVLFWVGLVLREDRLRLLIPFRK